MTVWYSCKDSRFWRASVTDGIKNKWYICTSINLPDLFNYFVHVHDAHLHLNMQFLGHDEWLDYVKYHKQSHAL